MAKAPKRTTSTATQSAETQPRYANPRALRHYWRAWDIANRSKTKAWRNPSPTLAYIALKHEIRADRALTMARG